MLRHHLYARLAFALALAGCTPEALTALNPLTGEMRSFESAEEVPDGWIICASEDSCPPPRGCGDLDEASCLARTDCSPIYVGIGAYPRECDGPEPPDICDGEAYAGCTDAGETCELDACGPILAGASWVCEDGTIGGATGRCLRNAEGSCGWETRRCPPPPADECTPDECGPAPASPAYECWDGSTGGNTGRCLRDAAGVCGWEFRDCPPDDCSAIPLCDLACPPGTENPVDAAGCTHWCECVPSECTREECGSPPDGPICECADGSVGCNTGNCVRNAEGSCGYEWRECPPPPPEECSERECGSPPDSPTCECADGSIGCNTGRCLRDAAGVCGWEYRECPDPCADIRMCRFLCPEGTHNPIDENGCVHTCECEPDPSDSR
jgi:hypothetical protein